jgi:hypothetical protein
MLLTLAGTFDFMTSFPFLIPQFGIKMVFAVLSLSLKAGGSWIGGMGGGTLGLPWVEFWCWI